MIFHFNHLFVRLSIVNARVGYQQLLSICHPHLRKQIMSLADSRDHCIQRGHQITCQSGSRGSDREAEGDRFKYTLSDFIKSSRQSMCAVIVKQIHSLYMSIQFPGASRGIEFLKCQQVLNFHQIDKFQNLSSYKRLQGYHILQMLVRLFAIWDWRPSQHPPERNRDTMFVTI